MLTLILTYAVAWAAISAYAAVLALGRRRLVRRLDRLEADTDGESPDSIHVQSAA
jgi:CcmD family protein